MEKIDFSKALNSFNISELIGPWVLQVFALILAVFLFNFSLKLFFRKLAKRAEQSSNPWDDAFIHSVVKPLRLLIWIVVILFAADIAASRTEAEIFKAIDPIRNISIVSILAWFLIRFVKEFEKAYIKQQSQRGKPVDLTTTHALGRLVRASIFITMALVMMQTLGFSIAGVLAFGGIGGIAIGFAAKDLLSNFFWRTNDSFRSPI